MRKIIFVLLVALIGFSCTNQRQQKIDLINAAENELMTSATEPIDNAKAAELASLYAQFVTEFPKDSISDKLLFKEAEILMNINRPKEAVAVIDSLIANYSESRLLPQAMHLKGFIYDDKIHSPEMAKISFEALIKRFPEHELSKNAADYIKILGKTPEEVIKEFERRQQKADSLN